MLTVAEARSCVLEKARALPPRLVALVDALGCVLDEDAVADADSPPFDKALVDGFAVRSLDLEGPLRRLAVGERIMAGQTPSRALGPREAAVIMTGAPIPENCDAVIMHERTQMDGADVVVLEPHTRPGQNLMPRGREMRLGDAAVQRGSILNPVRLGTLAAIGLAWVKIVPRPTVAIVPTGDELVEPDQTPAPGQIRNSTATMLGALVTQAGALPQVLPIARDLPEPLRQILERGLGCDVMMVSGGVSAGQRDLVPAALEALGVECLFHKVRLKPGKPLWFGIGPDRGEKPGTLVFGLPGNPVSGLVGFLAFVKPALAVLAGKRQQHPDWHRARLAQRFSHRGDRTTFYPARMADAGSDWEGAPTIETLPWWGSADLRGVSLADGFAIFAPGDRDYGPGEIVDFLPLR
jgi:molybdopterin molybdotransferase